MKDKTAPATVMVVDDTPANLRYLQDIWSLCAMELGNRC